MTTHEIRRRFLEFFEGKGHLVVPSASLVPYEDDPSVLLTIAGMQPLKSYFMGTAEPPARRMASCQKCFRTGDIDQIGRTARHLTFFEMLGNFSIGDYFKAEAIPFAYEFATDVLGFDPDQIWITVFEGMEGVPADDEARERWLELGIPAGRIQALGEADNFWKAGPTGPCGPNTELYLDRGERFGPAGGPVTGGDRFLEFWNVVFMQYDRTADGSLGPLPAQNIDTGAGLERIAAICQGKDSVFETDAFTPIIEWVQSATGKRYGADGRDDRALRVLADHGRAMTFLAADGIRPGNEGRDYVLRRIVRRAINEGGHLGLPPEFVVELSGRVVDGWGDVYPGLVVGRDDIAITLGQEAEQFARTLAQGQRILRDVMANSAGGVVAGDDAFRLYDTYGFPLDLTVDAAEEAGLAVDVDRFEALMTEQRDRARRAHRRDDGAAREQVLALAASCGPSIFVGYDERLVSVRVTAVSAVEDGDLLVKLDRSPFYPQGGGQVSDSGELCSPEGRAAVREVYRVGDDQVLRVRPSAEMVIAVGDEVVAAVDADERDATEANHTATHLLNWALRETLGAHIHQAGSYVGPDKLRFDFTHRDRIDGDERAELERRVIERIAANLPVTATQMPRAEADSSGAIGLFEEKYGDVVRVVDAGPGSRELCGGTHVPTTGEIADFAIIGEQSVGSGTRRIEALTGDAVAHWRSERAAQADAERTAREARTREAEARRSRGAEIDVGAIVGAAEAIGTVSLVATEVGIDDMDELLALSDRLKSAVGASGVVVLAARADGKAMLAVNLGVDAISAGLAAGAIVREIAPLVDGGGGGRDQLARAGGKRPEGIPDALAAARRYVEQRIGSKG